MNHAERMRHLINLAKGAEQASPETLNESGSTVKNFARWGKVNEAWPGEPASEPTKVTVYQDKDPQGTGEWFWLRSADGHVVASGSAPTEDEAYEAAGMKEEVLIAPELEEGGKMNAAWLAGAPPYSDEEQMSLASYKAGGGPAEGITEFIASIRDGSINDPKAPMSPEDKARADAALADLRTVEGALEEDVVVMHLLRPRGGSECGAECDADTCSPEINDVTCPDCHKGHDEYMKQFESVDLDEMFNEVHGVEEESKGPEVDTVTGPSYWASYLVNGDDSSLNPEEKAAADAWNERLGDWYVVGIADDEEGNSQEPRFTNSYDIHSGTDIRGGDVVDYIVHKSHTPIKEDEGSGLHVDYTLDKDELPEDCIYECSAQGNVEEAVEHWRKQLNFTVDRDKAIACLAGYGSWEPEELAEMDDDDIANKILWLACSTFKEGDNLFVLE